MTEQNLNIGKFIKGARVSKGLTIRELSERTGITASMLSQIERDLANPSINTLKILSDELKVPIYKFFKADDDEEHYSNLVVRKNERKTLGNPNTNMSYDLLTPNTRGNIEFCMMRLVPSDGERSVKLSHFGEEVLLILSGKTDIYIEDTRITLEEGDSILIPAKTGHSYCNPYDETCEAVFAITPPSF